MILKSALIIASLAVQVFGLAVPRSEGAMVEAAKLSTAALIHALPRSESAAAVVESVESSLGAFVHDLGRRTPLTAVEHDAEEPNEGDTEGKKCRQGWCGAPFCFPRCKPERRNALEGVEDGVGDDHETRKLSSDAVVRDIGRRLSLAGVEKDVGEVNGVEREGKKKCNPGWCGAPFCFPRCKPKVRRDGEEVTGRVARAEGGGHERAADSVVDESLGSRAKDETPQKKSD